jgi:Short C-terminal domain/SmpA / OmlA family
MKTTAFGLLCVALLAGCVTADRLNDVRIGMTKAQVIALLGTPDSTSAQANIEYLTYYLATDTTYGRDVPYMVRLVDGKVESFGRFAQLSDIYMRPVDGSPPQINLGMPYPTAVPAAKPDLATQLQQLKVLKDQGALTEQEFEQAKQKLLSGPN